MIPVESEEATNCLPKAQSKPSITQPDCPGVVASTNGEKDDDCDTVMPLAPNEVDDCDTVMSPAPDEDVSSRIPEISQACVNLAEAAFTELPLNALISEETNRTSHDGDDAVLGLETLEELAYRFLDPYSTLGIQGSSNSDQGWFSDSDLTSAAEDMERYSQTHTSEFSCPFEYELEKLRREKENSRKKFDDSRSELKTELDRKMAELRSEYDGKLQELDAEYNAKATESKTNMSLVGRNSLLANAFVSKCTDPAAPAPQRPAVTATSSHMSSTASFQPSVTAAAEAPVPNQSGPLLQFSSCTTTKPKPISQQAAVQSNTAEALPLHSPRSNTTQTQPRPPPPLISSLTPSSYQPVYGIVRTPAPHLQQAYRASRTPNASASTTYQRRLAQEHQQQQGNSKGEVVCISDDDE